MSIASANIILGTEFGRSLANRMFRLFGWSVTGSPPPVDKMVIVAAPHTSNWDWLLMIGAGLILGVNEAYWLGKHTLFQGMSRMVMRKLGGIPVYRRDPADLVEQLVEAFTERDKLLLVITPEGTRGFSSRWKSGFYRVARASGVPIALGYVDYERKSTGIGPLIWPSDNIRADMDKIRKFYADKYGRFAERQGPIWISLEHGD